MSLTELSLAGNNLITPDYRENLVRGILAGDGKIATLFYSVVSSNEKQRKHKSTTCPL
jgi:hypothetical protein